jgi:Pyruvate/2-oxoacid:ferredoxin oxidoreductase delta subunit
MPGGAGINSSRYVCDTCEKIYRHYEAKKEGFNCPECGGNLIRKLGVYKKVGKSVRKMPIVDVSVCVGCGKCMAICPADAISMKDKVAFINKSMCRKCGLCISECPVQALT